jgi:hypothetical protein
MTPGRLGRLNYDGEFTEQEDVMCTTTSPGGHLVCANPTCNGRSHVWIHESSAPDYKRDLDSTDAAAA